MSSSAYRDRLQWDVSGKWIYKLLSWSIKYNPHKMDKLLTQCMEWGHALKVILTIHIHVNVKQTRNWPHRYFCFLYEYTLGQIMKERSAIYWHLQEVGGKWALLKMGIRICFFSFSLLYLPKQFSKAPWFPCQSWTLHSACEGVLTHHSTHWGM